MRVNPNLFFPRHEFHNYRGARARICLCCTCSGKAAPFPQFLIWIAFFVSLLDIYLLSSWLPTVFHNAGITLSLSVAATAVFQGGGVVASLILGIFIDRFGAFRTVAFIYLMGAVSVALLGYAIPLSLIMLAAFFAGAGIVGGQTGTNVLAASLYPTYIRSTGVGWGLGIGRIGSIVGPIFGGLMLSMHFPLTMIFFAAAISALLASAAIFLMGQSRSRHAGKEQQLSPEFSAIDSCGSARLQPEKSRKLNCSGLNWPGEFNLRRARDFASAQCACPRGRSSRRLWWSRWERVRIGLV